MEPCGIDGLRAYNSDPDENGKILPIGGRPIEETFPCLCVFLCTPPVFRSPFFPVFFYTGNRRYKRELSRNYENEARVLVNCLFRMVELQREIYKHSLSRAIQEIDDMLDDPVSFYHGSRKLGDKAEDPPTWSDYISDLFPHTKYFVTSDAGHLYTVIFFYFFDILFFGASECITQFTSRLLPNIFTRKHEGHHDAPEKMRPLVKAEQISAEYSPPTHSHLPSSDIFSSRKVSSCLPRPHSKSSLSQINSENNKNLTQAKSLSDMLLKDSFEEFTPDVTVDENEETYSFHCSRPGLYQCSVTGLVFHMEGEGDVVYRIFPWNYRLLAQHHKKPAGPLFDIKCLQQSVCQLHLPHCEIFSTGGCEFLSVAHLNDDDIEFITPNQLTETHVIINITGFSSFGNVKDEGSPPVSVRALVLLFYKPPTDPDPESLLNVLLLPKNVVLPNVLRIRKKLVGDERYIETPGHCKLLPKQEYTLSTSPEDDSVLVQPTEAEFDEESYDNYVSSFQVNLEKILKNINLLLRDTNSSQSVWERKVCLLSTGVRRTCGPSALILPSNERLMEIRTDFIDGISGPVLKSLLDKMFEKKVITDSERESADEMQNKNDKARFVIDTVRKKGEAASSEMIEFLCEVDPFLCEHLGLM